ncbi:dicarboxylate/amino acid:cation symporter [Sphingomonas sp.]|uniref:dicarboxylate/amino acid:cation symporter n=1 Tax=Sphingomonas sp. TaxID=28214 RepID=UPI001D659763|nr:dicarboxylate/amino acid:cation symporter [Sphingomonas sp.]MBX9796822.1 dicarboxylate/amino acid:cation symporter [Sphingomonas sp.]
MGRKLTFYIMIGLGLGLVTGWALHAAILAADPATAETLKGVAQVFPIITTLFLRLIKMIIAPLVLSTLVVGIAHMGDTSALGRIGLRALGWFVCASLLSLTLGMVLVHVLQPGVGLGLALPAAAEASGIDKAAFNLKDFITHVVPSSIIDAMAKNEIIQIVVFSIFAGVAITAIGKQAQPLVDAAEALAAVMLRITNYVMLFAPVAVFAAVANSLAERGPEVIGDLGYFMLSFYLALIILWALLAGIGFVFLGSRIVPLVRVVRDPLILAFSTASSEAAYPRTLEALEKFGVPPKIASFMLPLGYSFNLDGSMMYMTFASLFVAQAYGIHLSLSAQITMLLVLMVTSKGIAGVPRASLVVVAATLPLFKIPEAGLLLILAVDHFLDMGRSATNVVGNAVATAIIAKWEGTLETPGEEAPRPA